eukprot:597897-Pyramimonas_sp.AAC.1
MRIAFLLRSISRPSHDRLGLGMPRDRSMLNSAIGRRPVILTNGSAIWTLTPYSEQEARDG